MASQQPDGFWQTDPGENYNSLTGEQKLHNANLVYRYFIPYWTKKAICAMLGNMDVESRMNPVTKTGDQWGLVQWSPSNKLTDWAERHGLIWEYGSTQCARIKFEWDFPDKAPQWRPMETGVSFYEWSQMTDETLDRMTHLFRYCYETAKPESEPERKWYAQFYFDNLPLFNKLIIPCLSKNRRRGVIKYG